MEFITMQSLEGARFFVQPTGDTSLPSASLGAGYTVAKSSQASADPISTSLSLRFQQEVLVP